MIPLNTKKIQYRGCFLKFLARYMPDYFHYCGYCQHLSSLVKMSILKLVSHDSPLKIINNSFFLFWYHAWFRSYLVFSILMDPWVCYYLIHMLMTSYFIIGVRMYHWIKIIFSYISKIFCHKCLKVWSYDMFAFENEWKAF